MLQAARYEGKASRPLVEQCRDWPGEGELTRQQKCSRWSTPAGQSLAGVFGFGCDPRLTPVLVGRWPWETLVRKVGLEPTRGYPQRFLRPPRLPFRHFRLAGSPTRPLANPLKCLACDQ